MIDIAILRNDPKTLEAAIARRGLHIDVEALVVLDQARRSVRIEAEDLRARQKQSGKAIAQLEGDQRQEAIESAGRIAAEYKAKLAKAEELDADFDEQWIRIPNLVDDSVPDGYSEDDSVEFKRWGDVPTFDFEPLDHRMLGESLDMIDTERAARLSGTRFGYLMGPAVFMEFGLVRFALDRLAERGFTPVVPPVLVREHALFGTGFFPDTEQQIYKLADDDLYLVGTAEVPLAGLHMDEILAEEDLPVRYAGFSTCFRRESGAAGRDTTGIFRVHQFDKVEMFSFCHPDRSHEEHEFLFETEESIIQALELPYRVVNVAVGDLGGSAAKKYDIEAWFPGQNRYREITSCSNTTDFQARRLKVRFRSERGNALVHTLNGTAIAVGRILIALMENHQQADGSILIPEALQQYVGFDRIG